MSIFGGHEFESRIVSTVQLVSVSSMTIYTRRWLVARCRMIHEKCEVSG